nr:uncharacterized protein LOC120974427 [Aegilops tauschii subsp. strangulata]
MGSAVSSAIADAAVEFLHLDGQIVDEDDPHGGPFSTSCPSTSNNAMSNASWTGWSASVASTSSCTAPAQKCAAPSYTSSHADWLHPPASCSIIDRSATKPSFSHMSRSPFATTIRTTRVQSSSLSVLCRATVSDSGTRFGFTSTF